MNNTSEPKIIIVGAGLVGCLAAVYLSKNGYNVTIFEYRNDIRKSTTAKGKSINLALSTRGLNALQEAGIPINNISQMSVPMKGRMIHEINGKCRSLLYDVKYHRNIFSVGRNELNKLLLAEAEKNCKIIFRHKVLKIDFQKREIQVLRIEEDKVLEENFDYLIGCDGAYSTVRLHMLKTPFFNYSQKYINHGYMELSISAEKSKEFKMNREHLHIWPRVSFMMIALPNANGSWTVTLFMPFEEFEKIQDARSLLTFFGEHFSDALPLIEEKNLIDIFFSTKAQPLISVKCDRYNVRSHGLVMGDAAHSVVPFYGQGMNAGFEDCQVLSEILKRKPIEEVFEEFSGSRCADGKAISELSMYNYLEMRNLVLNRPFLIKKRVDNFLYKLIPNLWIPLYICVTFSAIPYSKCLRIQNTQNKILMVTITAVLICLYVLMYYAAFTFSPLIPFF